MLGSEIGPRPLIVASPSESEVGSVRHAILIPDQELPDAALIARSQITDARSEVDCKIGKPIQSRRKGL